MVHSDLPSFFRSADAASLDGQRRYLSQIRWQLAALLAAAGAGALSVVLGTWLGWVAGASFIIAAMLRLHTGHARYDRRWYQGRAAAESAKTLAWRFAVGGRPFSLTVTDEEARRTFVEQLAATAWIARDVAIAPDPADGAEVTVGMQRLRRADLTERMSAYRTGRLEDQRSWYARKAKENLESHRRWQRVAFGSEVLGALYAIGIATGHLAVDALGAIGVVAGATIAWMNVKQYWNLSTAYSVAAQELGQVLTLANQPFTEVEWAEFVDESEEAISREHKLWVASRGVLR